MRVKLSYSTYDIAIASINMHIWKLFLSGEHWCLRKRKTDWVKTHILENGLR